MAEEHKLAIPKKLDAAPKGQSKHYCIPSFYWLIVLEVARRFEVPSFLPGLPGASLDEGTRGHLRCGYGTSMYDFHVEVPLEGTGVPLDAALVVELDADGNEVKTPYLEWCRRLGLKITCTRCGEDIVAAKYAICPRRARHEAAQRKQRKAEKKLESRRKEWVTSGQAPTPLVREQAAPESHDLRRGVDTLAEAREAAREYSYDYEGVHIVGPDHGSYDIYATGFRDAPGAGADSASLTDERDWPIPILG